MSDRTVLITGATDGLGRALAVRLAADGVRLVLHGRSAERLEAVADEVTGAGAPAPVTVRADLASLAEVAALAAQVRERVDRLDVLVSNAGIGSGEPDGRTRRTSVDGYELRFAINHLAGFLLVGELLDLVEASAAPEAPSRIVHVASLGQHPLDFDDLMLTRGYEGSRAYAQSKLAQIMSGIELSTRIPDGRVTVNSLHPGTYMPTKMVLQEIGRSVDTLETGVEATRRLAVDPELAGTTGGFFDRLQPALANAQAYDAAARATLWERSTELVAPFASRA
jgi:NAD(P)-dependent dehydrogenase (short-subunit alcohol dehydrogenase family)